MENAERIQPCVCRDQLYSSVIWMMAIGMMTLSAAFMKLANAHRATSRKLFGKKWKRIMSKEQIGNGLGAVCGVVGDSKRFQSMAIASTHSDT